MMILRLLLMISFILPSALLCGPQSMGGRSHRFAVKDWLKPGEHLPQGTSEVSMFGSGKRDEDKSMCTKKIQILATDIVFEDPTYHSESRLATKVFHFS